MRERIVTALVVSAGLLLGSPAHAEVNVGINIGVPAPPPVIVASPQLVVVPGTSVSYSPGVSFNLFVFGGRYYSLHDGVWFSAVGHGGPWVIIAPERVPRPVLAVPVTYYRIPPGHAKKMGDGDGGPPGQAKGPKGKKGRPD